MDQEFLEFPLWLRINHFINLFCIFVLMRSGVQILADHTKLYWNDDTTLGSEWIKFGKKVMPKDRLWTSMDEAPATPDQKTLLAKLSAQQVTFSELAGETIQAVLTHAPGNGAPIGGLQVAAERGWFAARPSGTEDIYKIYTESFRGDDHLRRIVEEAQAIVNNALTTGTPHAHTPY